MDYFDEEVRELPKCHNCGEECVVGFDECIETEGEIYCSTVCFIEDMMKEVGASWV